MNRFTYFSVIVAIYFVVLGVNRYQLHNISAEICDDLTVLNFGPSPINAGKPFNVQPSGKSAIWVKLTNAAPSSYAFLFINGIPIDAAVKGDLVTATVPNNAYANSGNYPMKILFRKKTGMCQTKNENFVVL